MSLDQYTKHFKSNINLALPIMFGQLSHVITGMVDSIMVGNVGSQFLAASSFANNVFNLLYLFSIGICIGLTPLIGIANGEKDNEQISSLLKNSLVLNFMVAIIATILNLLVIPFLDQMGQPTNVVEIAIPYYIIISLSIIPYNIFITFKQFAEGIHSTKPAMVVSIVCNIVNVILNYFLIYGIWLFPKLDLLGAGIATFISRLMMPITFFIILINYPKYKVYWTSTKKFKIDFSKIKQILNIGIPIAFQILLEVIVFAIGGIMVGWFGAKQLAAHQITMTLATFTFLASQGLSNAGTIKVSNYLGEKNFREIKNVGISVIMMVVFVMIVFALLIFNFRFDLASIFVSETDVVKIASELMIIAALFQIFDGVQVACHALLRGLHDVKIPTYISFLSYFLVGLGLCFILAAKFGMEAKGVWIGFLIILIFIATLLLLRLGYIINIKIKKIT